MNTIVGENNIFTATENIKAINTHKDEYCHTASRASGNGSLFMAAGPQQRTETLCDMTENYLLNHYFEK
jgi:hypothetical protein